ncbi:DUF222 domain-containing protein [uncultured Jatrophihabitans sp.]|uniref:HNH endonuclease signature motif containing protein n=1 Tax=uncultured Jatrophihabitans sp. TaxID=1610747 RepID=UPI0035CAA4A6
MSDTLTRADLATLLADAHHVVDALQAVELSACTDDGVVAAVRSFESLRRRLEPVDHALIGEVEARGVPARAMARATGYWLRQTLTIDISEANARVRAAHAAGPRRSLLGEPMPARYPAVAAAQAAGELAARQARVITATLDKLPLEVCEHIPVAEARLVGFARTFEAATLQQLATREAEWLDPDAGYRDVERRRRDRDLQVHHRPDGSCSFRGEGTAELGEFLQVTFDSLAKPEPESNDIKDPRTAGQRRHDALLDALKITVGSGKLPTAGGVLATVVLTIDADTYLTGDGFALTGHGAQVPVREALSWAGGDYRLMCTALNSLKAVEGYSSTHRLFTEGQRLALIARDRGCAFPGCLAPPGWCQIHHILEHILGGPTTLDNAVMLCGHHHRTFQTANWTVDIVNGRPQWTPPRTIDPDRTPIPV